MYLSNRKVVRGVIPFLEPSDVVAYTDVFSFMRPSIIEGLQLDLSSTHVPLTVVRFLQDLGAKIRRAQITFPPERLDSMVRLVGDCFSRFAESSARELHLIGKRKVFNEGARAIGDGIRDLEELSVLSLKFDRSNISDEGTQFRCTLVANQGEVYRRIKAIVYSVFLQWDDKFI